MHDDELDERIRGGAGHDAGAACTRTPEYDLGRLLALRDGREDADALRHLGECAFCRALAQDAGEPVGEMLAARMGRAWPAARRWPIFAGVATAVAAAAALFLLLTPRAVETPVAFEMEGPLGGLTAVRADVAGSDVFLPDSQVLVVLRPVEAGRPPLVAAFVSDPAGPLRRLPESAVERRDNGSFLLRGLGRELFGDAAGRKRLYVVVGHDASRLAALDGAPAPAPRGEGLRWYEAEVDYRLTP